MDIYYIYVSNGLTFELPGIQYFLMKFSGSMPNNYKIGFTKFHEN